jgi:hypothetical protein
MNTTVFHCSCQKWNVFRTNNVSLLVFNWSSFWYFEEFHSEPTHWAKKTTWHESSLERFRKCQLIIHLVFSCKLNLAFCFLLFLVNNVCRKLLFKRLSFFFKVEIDLTNFVFLRRIFMMIFLEDCILMWELYEDYVWSHVQML